MSVMLNTWHRYCIEHFNVIINSLLRPIHLTNKNLSTKTFRSRLRGLTWCGAG